MSNKICEGTKILTKYGFVDVKDLEGQETIFINADGEKFKGIIEKSTDKSAKKAVTLTFQSEINTTPINKEVDYFEGQEILTLDGEVAVANLKGKEISQAKMKNVKLEYNEEFRKLLLSYLYKKADGKEEKVTYKYENVFNQLGKYVSSKDDVEIALLDNTSTRLFTPEQETWFVNKNDVNTNITEEIKKASVFGKAYIADKYIEKAKKAEEDNCCFSIKDVKQDIFDEEDIKEIYALAGCWYLGKLGKKIERKFFATNGWKCTNVEDKGEGYSYSINSSGNANSFVDSNGIVYKL